MLNCIRNCSYIICNKQQYKGFHVSWWSDQLSFRNEIQANFDNGQYQMEEMKLPLLDPGLTIHLLRNTDMISSLFKSSAVSNIRNSAVSFHKFAT